MEFMYPYETQGRLARFYAASGWSLAASKPYIPFGVNPVEQMLEN